MFECGQKTEEEDNIQFNHDLIELGNCQDKALGIRKRKVTSLVFRF